MKAEWVSKTLGDVYDVRDGTHDSPKYHETGYPLITSKNLKRDGLSFDNVNLISELDYKKINERSAVHRGDVLLAMIGTIGNPTLVEVEPNFAIKNVALFKIPNGQNGAFLRHYLDSGWVSSKMMNEAKGTTQKFVGLGYLRDFPINIPPLPEQQRIVTILDEAFDGIATAKANAEKNLQNARALFESHLQSVFTQRGEGWVEKKLSDVCAITSKLIDPRKEEFLDLIHVGAGNIVSQTGIFIDLKAAREEGLISGKFLFDETMVLYSKIRPYLMKVARPDFDGLCSADMYPLAPLSNEITRDYLFHLLLSKHFTDYAIEGSARAGMPKVNREHLFDFRVWLPTVEKQNELAAKLDALHAETQRLESIYLQKLAALDALKKSLLDQAFTGAL